MIMKQMVIASFALSIVLIGFTNCRYIPQDPSQHFHPVRAAPKLSNENIPALRETQQTRAAERPWLEHAGVIEFKYRWEYQDGVAIGVSLYVAETKEIASNWLLERRASASLPMDFYFPRDDPAVVGDISFGGGQQFIRDNIVIVFRSDTTITEMAQQIDSLILDAPVRLSARQMTPLISTFTITENPVQFRSTTRLIIDVENPVNGELFYDWRFTPGSENWGGIERDESGNFYYCADTYEPVEYLTVYVINDAGFYSSKTLAIHIQF